MATQTEPDVEKNMGPRGPGGNVMNELFMPHLATTPPPPLAGGLAS